MALTSQGSSFSIATGASQLAHGWSVDFAQSKEPMQLNRGRDWQELQQRSVGGACEMTGEDAKCRMATTMTYCDITDGGSQITRHPCKTNLFSSAEIFPIF